MPRWRWKAILSSDLHRKPSSGKGNSTMRKSHSFIRPVISSLRRGMDNLPKGRTRIRDQRRLSKVILFGERSLRRALSEYVEHFHADRNHQGNGNVLLFPRGTNKPQAKPCDALNSRRPQRLRRALRLPACARRSRLCRTGRRPLRFRDLSARELPAGRRRHGPPCS